jgi:uncharacterized protein involved in type VI secretion and phage assembly
MNPVLKRQILREFPEFENGFHLPVLAEVIAISDPPNEPSINDNYRPRYAVDIQLLDSQFKTKEIELSHVPVSMSGGGHERGLFALPEVGTLVEIAWLNGSAELPFVRSILPFNKQNPVMDAQTQKWQQSDDVSQSVDKNGHWKRTTPNKITDEANSIEQIATEKLVQVLNQLEQIAGHSIEEVAGIKKIEAGAVHLLAESIINMLSIGSINQVAMEHITRNATKDIHDKAGGEVRRECAGNQTEQVGGDSATTTIGSKTEKAAKLYIGNDSDNLLSLVKDFMGVLNDTLSAIQVLTVPTAVGPSSPPVNVASFVSAASSLAIIKSKLESMTV